MKDDFLYRVRPGVRREFAEQLWRRLDGQGLEVSQKQPQMTRLQKELEPRRHEGNEDHKGETTVRRRARWGVGLMLAVVVLVMGLVVGLSQPARAGALRWLRQVAGFAVEERGQSPLAGVEAGAGPGGQGGAVAAEGGETAQPEGARRSTVYAVPTQGLPQALENPPFPFGLPGWVPEGYRLGEQVALANSGDWVLLTWSHPDGSEIVLLVERGEAGAAVIPAGEGSSEAVQVNGQPALLVRGDWDGQHEWDARRGLKLDWRYNGLHYRLSYAQRDRVRNEIQPISGDVEGVVEMLVRMAESVR